MALLLVGLHFLITLLAVSLWRVFAAFSFRNVEFFGEINRLHTKFLKAINEFHNSLGEILQEIGITANTDFNRDFLSSALQLRVIIRLPFFFNDLLYIID